MFFPPLHRTGGSRSTKTSRASVPLQLSLARFSVAEMLKYESRPHLS
jgi:hypothetical protein